MQFRSNLLRSCILHDKSWSLYFGRPTSINSSSSMLPCCRSPSTGSPGSPFDVDTPTAELKAQIAMLDLAEMTIKFQQTAHMRNLLADKEYLELAASDSELNSWYEALPADLRWTPENLENATSMFFLLQ